MGKMVGRLYLIDEGCYNQTELDYYTNFLRNTMSVCNNVVENCYSSNVAILSKKAL